MMQSWETMRTAGRSRGNSRDAIPSHPEGCTRRHGKQRRHPLSPRGLHAPSREAETPSPLTPRAARAVTGSRDAIPSHPEGCTRRHGKQRRHPLSPRGLHAPSRETETPSPLTPRAARAVTGSRDAIPSHPEGCTRRHGIP
ncbi:hypothetical protein ACOMHN_063782 [Nucella lapillus]